MNLSLNLALLSCLVLGLRHGFDYDHLAAITDIASVQEKHSRSMLLGLLYALGHAITVAILGVAVIVFQLSLPAGLDRWAERLVGITLLLLGFYVLSSLFRKPEAFIPKSRPAMLLHAIRWTKWKLSSWLHLTSNGAPAFRSWNYDVRTVFFVGVIHGLGAETPSQLMIFLLAANLGGISKGFLGLSMFLAGLLVMNTLMMAFATGIFGVSSARPKMLRVATAATAVYSLTVGCLFLFNAGSLLPPLS